MRLPRTTIIAAEKIKDYLLLPKKRNDKSKWLVRAGYTLENWQSLEEDLRKQVLPLEAVLKTETEYGLMYEIDVSLTGPNGKSISARTIWMKEHETNVTKFITMYPHKS